MSDGDGAVARYDFLYVLVGSTDCPSSIVVVARGTPLCCVFSLMTMTSSNALEQCISNAKTFYDPVPVIVISDIVRQIDTYHRRYFDTSDGQRGGYGSSLRGEYSISDSLSGMCHHCCQWSTAQLAQIDRRRESIQLRSINNWLL